LNYLAHIYLSGADDDLLLGNFIGDFVKGHDWEKYPERVGQGIQLHRFIDTYTDAHPECAALRTTLHPLVGKYAGVALDMLFDHFLAQDWEEVTDEKPLAEFVPEAYRRLEARIHQMPERAAYMFSVMQRYDWLTSYATSEGLQQSLDGLYRRTGERALGFPELLTNEGLDLHRIRNTFHRFFPDLQRNSLLKINSFAGN
jgi:acyl carrier protein phosphodiesterase